MANLGRLLIFLALIMSAMSFGRARSSRETIQLTVGVAKTITLNENKTTGFAWHIETGQSTNLSVLRVTDLGHQQASSHLLGAPGTHSWRIEAVAPGKANLVLAYSRPWEHVAPAKLCIVHIEIAREQR